MVAFRLPSDSRVQPGSIFQEKATGPKKRIYIYRYDPDTQENPRIDRFDLHMTKGMVLDALSYIKQHMDGSLTFRRSCREGICGSCAMNINGQNTLACVSTIDMYPKDIIIYPLPHMPVIKDLVPDITHAVEQYMSSQPWLCPEDQENMYEERRQSPQERKELDGLWECILCFCCSSSCPSYWWNGQSYLGPATLLQAERFLSDSRDNAFAQRLQALDDTYKLFRCHTILNCAKACPKRLNPAKAISRIKRRLWKK